MKLLEGSVNFEKRGKCVRNQVKVLEEEKEKAGYADD